MLSGLGSYIEFLPRRSGRYLGSRMPSVARSSGCSALSEPAYFGRDSIRVRFRVES